MHSRRLTSDVHPTINVPTSQNVDQQVQNSTTHNIPLPPIGGSSGDESSSQNQAETSRSPFHRPSTGKGTWRLSCINSCSFVQQWFLLFILRPYLSIVHTANDLLAQIRTMKEEW